MKNSQLTKPSLLLDSVKSALSRRVKSKVNPESNDAFCGINSVFPTNTPTEEFEENTSQHKGLFKPSNSKIAIIELLEFFAQLEIERNLYLSSIKHLHSTD